MRNIFIVAVVMIMGIVAKSEEIPEPIRPVAASYTFEFGSSRLNDTYLTPLTYTGWSTAFTYERYQAMKFSPEKWIQNLKITAGFGATENPARNAQMYQAGFTVGWGMLRRWNLPSVKGISLAVGAEAEVAAGALYLSRNGNNPVTAKASVTFAPAALAVYNFRIKSLPVTLRYQTALPLIGAFFSQQYGELYYEIYLGDRSGLVCFANPASYFRFCNTVSADLRFGSTYLRLGYRNNLTSTHIHHLTTNLSSHSFIIGIAGEWISLNSRRALGRDARIISAIY